MLRWSWILLDLLLRRAFTLWLLMQPLERSNSTVYIRHLLERPPFLPTTDYAWAQVWQMISCCSFWWLFASGQPQAVSELADVSALLSSQVCLLILASPKPLPGRNQPLYPTPHTHIHVHLDLQPEYCGILYYSSLWLILVGLKCRSQGTISLLLFWAPD